MEKEDDELDRGLYALLHLSPDASDEDIRRAYRQMAQAYHPDKHQSPQMQEAATENFQRIRDAYEILSDERKRKIYDLYGMEGLNSGLELGPKQKSVDEILKAFEKLQEVKREKKLAERGRHSGSLLVNISMEDALYRGPVLRGMTSHTEFHSHISKKSALVLGGDIAFQERLGGGTLSALLRHQISPEAEVEAVAMVGLRSLLSIQTSRQLSSRSTGAIGISISLNDGSFNLTNVWTRQLSDQARGTIQLVVGPDAAIAVGWDQQGPKNSGSGEVKIGVTGFGVTANYNHTFSANSRGRITGRLSNISTEVEIGGERRISSHSAMAMFCTVGLNGVSMKLRFTRGGHKFIVPILLSSTLNPWTAAGALLVPSSLYGLLKVYVFKPLYLLRKEKRQREQRLATAAQVAESRAKAEKSQSLIRIVAERNREKQSKIGGLVIVNAMYGNIVEYEKKQQVQDYSEGTEASEDNDLPPPVLDVTTTLNFLVDDTGRLQLHNGVKKSGLIGFCDPCPGEPKQLKVVYTYQNKQFEVTVGDFDELAIP